jgi:hypothetical protein
MLAARVDGLLSFIDTKCGRSGQLVLEGGWGRVRPGRAPSGEHQGSNSGGSSRREPLGRTTALDPGHPKAKSHPPRAAIRRL